MKLKTSDVLFREDLYPRFEANQELIQKYANSLEHLPPIKINQNNILIDGYHRWKAHQLEEKPEIEVEVIEVESEKELKKLAYQLNSNHGLQLNNKEKAMYAQEMIGDMTAKELSIILSVTEDTVIKWTASQREAIKEERDRKIVELHLRAWNTQKNIADILGINEATVNGIIQQILKNNKFIISKDDELKLVGEDGNAFAIMGRAKQAAKKAGYSKEEIDDILNEAMAGSYDELLMTMHKYFDCY